MRDAFDILIVKVKDKTMINRFLFTIIFSV
jgi:hypothetical protein